jgi:hypothetical protein
VDWGWEYRRTPIRPGSRVPRRSARLQGKSGRIRWSQGHKVTSWDDVQPSAIKLMLINGGVSNTTEGLRATWSDASPGDDASRLCTWCQRQLPATFRSDACKVNRPMLFATDASPGGRQPRQQTCRPRRRRRQLHLGSARYFKFHVSPVICTRCQTPSRRYRSQKKTEAERLQATEVQRGVNFFKNRASNRRTSNDSYFEWRPSSPPEFDHHVLLRAAK